MPSMLAAAQIHGLSTESINAWLMWSAAVLALVSLLASSLVVALGRWHPGASEVAVGLTAVVIASIILAWTDPFALGFPMGWRFLSLAIALGAAWFATRAVIGHRRRRAATTHLASDIALGAGTFAGTLAIIVFVAIAVLVLA